MNITEQRSPIVNGTIEKKLLKLKVIKQLFSIMRSRSGSVFKALKLVKQMKNKYKETFGQVLLTKAAKVDGRYFWRMGAPGFPSQASIKMHENEINRIDYLNKYNGLRSIIFAITKKCPLKCEHCFEWDNLNKPEQLETSDIINIIHKYQDLGTTQIMLSGGEPMLRIDDIYEILSKVKTRTDFWIITSGLGFNKEHAVKLKKAGLTGVMVSIDHFDGSKHNQFRGSEKAYDLATQAVIDANDADLVTTLSLCARKGFVSEDNLTAYMDLGKKLGVSFVQILEARKTGRYSGKDIELSKEEINILENIYLKYNSDKEFKDYPIINYFGYHQRRVGCFGGGSRFFYIDTDGDAHLCPFCSGKKGSTLEHSAEEMIDLLSKYKCHIYENCEN